MRHIKVSDGYAQHSERGNANTCGDCPIRAEVVPRNRPVCRYGHRVILSKHTQDCNARKLNGGAQ